METATAYAEEYGWQIVPLHPNPEVRDSDANDPVIRLLGRAPLVNLPEGASSDPEQIREWTGFPTASIAVLTGSLSNLVAVEIGPAAERGLNNQELKQLREDLGETRCVHGPDRDYYLFSLGGPERVPPNLPRLTRSDGVIFHGEGSLIRVPRMNSGSGVRAFRWDVQCTEALSPFPAELLSYFGIKISVDGLLSRADLPTETGNRTTGGRPASGDQAVQSKVERPCQDGLSLTLSSAQSGATKRSKGPRSECTNKARNELTFRSGEALSQRSYEDMAGKQLSWLQHGCLSLICSQTKTAEKSTFVSALAAHLAAGRTFLGTELEAQSAVVVSELQPAQFRSVLSRIDICKEARSRLHVLHPKDARKASWQMIIGRAFNCAERTEAGLVVVDSLDQFVEVKGNTNATSDPEVAHVLTTEAPSNCAVLAGKALSSTASEPMDETVNRLGLLGRAADLIAKIDKGPTETRPTFRRLQFRSQLAGVPSHLLFKVKCQRYQRVGDSRDPSVVSIREDECIREEEAASRVAEGVGTVSPACEERGGQTGTETEQLEHNLSPKPPPIEYRRLLEDTSRIGKS